MAKAPKAAQTETRLVSVKTLERGTFQCREKLDADTVKRYAEAMDAGVELPPVVLWTDEDGRVHVVDGEHRVQAATQQDGVDPAEDVMIRARWIQGTNADAWVYAIKSNGSNGLPYTPAERAAAIKRLHDERPYMTVREIAAAVGVGRSTVSRALSPPKPKAKESSETPKPDAMAAEIQLPKTEEGKPASKYEAQAAITCAGCGKTYTLSEVIELEDADIRWNGYRVAWLACTPECARLARETGLEAAADELIETATEEPVEEGDQERPETTAEPTEADEQAAPPRVVVEMLKRAGYETGRLRRLLKELQEPANRQHMETLWPVLNALRADLLAVANEIQEIAQGGAH